MDCSGDVPTFGEVGAFSKCTSCHSSTLSGAARADAPANVNFDTYAGAEAQATKAVEEVQEGQMPPPSTGSALSDAEKKELFTWALCGAME